MFIHEEAYCWQTNLPGQKDDRVHSNKAHADPFTVAGIEPAVPKQEIRCTDEVGAAYLPKPCVCRIRLSEFEHCPRVSQVAD